jgi:hypothetical protein
VILLNFSHPLTDGQVRQIESAVGAPLAEVRQVPAQFDHQQPFVPQAQALAEACRLTPQEWQTAPVLVIPPSLNFITAVLLAELHGRMGYFPPLARLRPVEGSLPPRYEVAEIINLQAVRDAARRRR